MANLKHHDNGIFMQDNNILTIQNNHQHSLYYKYKPVALGLRRPSCMCQHTVISACMVFRPQRARPSYQTRSLQATKQLL